MSALLGIRWAALALLFLCPTGTRHFPERISEQDGGTLVEASVTGRPTGLLRVMQPMVARTTQKNLDVGYARLKRLLETGSPSA